MEVDLVFVNDESDLMNEAAEDEVEDWTDRVESALVEMDPSSSVRLLNRLSVSMGWSSGTMVVVVACNLHWPFGLKNCVSQSVVDQLFHDHQLQLR